MRLVLLLLFLHAAPLSAAAKSVTLYLDGAKVEQEGRGARGYLEVRLPPSVRAGSLRVKPLGGGRVLRVEVVPAGEEPRVVREKSRLEERRGELTDRLKALSLRERIFEAALKSQSSKTPRRSRNNPDPLGALRRGTAFAAGELEGVYRERRRCRGALAAVEGALAAAGSRGGTARVWLSGGRARLSYLTGQR